MVVVSVWLMVERLCSLVWWRKMGLVVWGMVMEVWCVWLGGLGERLGHWGSGWTVGLVVLLGTRGNLLVPVGRAMRVVFLAIDCGGVWFGVGDCVVGKLGAAVGAGSWRTPCVLVRLDDARWHCSGAPLVTCPTLWIGLANRGGPV